MNILSVNVKPSTPGERGIPKRSVLQTNLYREGVEGDHNNYRTKKKGGTLDRAVLLLDWRVISDLHREGWPVRMGDLGENLTVGGELIPDFAIGQRYRIGTTGYEAGNPEITLTEEATPCHVLANLPYVGEEKVQDFIRTLMGRRGWYASVEKGGIVGVGHVLRRIN